MKAVFPADRPGSHRLASRREAPELEPALEEPVVQNGRAPVIDFLDRLYHKIQATLHVSRSRTREAHQLPGGR